MAKDHTTFSPGLSRLEEDLALEVEYHSEQRDHKCTAIGTIVMCNNDKKVQKTQMFLPKWPEPLHLRDVKSEVIATNHYQIFVRMYEPALFRSPIRSLGPISQIPVTFPSLKPYIKIQI